MSDSVQAALITGLFTLLAAAVTAWGVVYAARRNMEREPERGGVRRGLRRSAASPPPPGARGSRRRRRALERSVDE